jgi:hypothetical protein
MVASANAAAAPRSLNIVRSPSGSTTTTTVPVTPPRGPTHSTPAATSSAARRFPVSSAPTCPTNRAATELRHRDRGVRRAPAPVPFCVRRHVRAPYEQRGGAHHDVLDEIADTAHQGFHRLFPSRCAGLLPAMPLTVIDHPLVADRVLTLRDQRTKSVDFRRIAREIASFLAYET